ncbi:hypothetical protein GRF29_112g1387064 [Pseudopithomyces chartarum]|uniref:CN hydrolase domain-containing protein n=1 Tax=Pseudopithomyces chartarum TaxID=1892770 RepID=A0AAN6LSW2_9PLEO|nr:hypothetical protein GRF29_112g1387064 [Pseudopithomyces chartarum]
MVYSVILHVPRKPGLSPEEFKHHWEKIHVPLLKQLVGHDFPLSHTRHYIERPLDSTLDRGELASSEGPNSAVAIDGVAILTFGSKEHYERFGVKLADEKKRVVYEGDLRNFVDVGAMKGMFAGETKATGRDGGVVGWRIDVILTQPQPLDPEHNFNKAATFIKSAAAQGADLAVLPGIINSKLPILTPTQNF